MILGLSMLLYACLTVWFVVLWRRACCGAIATPLFLFGMHEIAFVWPSTIYGIVTGYSRDPLFPVIVAAGCFAAMLGGATAIALWRPGAALRFRTYRELPVLDGEINPASLAGIWVLVIGLTAIGLFLFKGLPPLASGLVELSRGGNPVDVINVIYEARTEATTGHFFGGAYRGQGVLMDVSVVGWEFLAVASTIGWMRIRTPSWRLSAVASWLGFLFFVGGSAQRWQALMGIVAILLALSLVVRPSKGVVAVTGAGMTLLYVIMSLLNSQFAALADAANPTATAATLMIERVFLGNGIHDIDIFNFVQDGSLSIAYGQIHLEKFLAALPGPSPTLVPFSVRLATLLDFRRADQTFASQTYLGWLYADFGSLGAIVVYACIGAALMVVQAWVAHQPRWPSRIAVAGLVVVSMGTMSLDGPVTAAATLVLLFSISALLRGIARVFAPAFMPRLAQPTRQ